MPWLDIIEHAHAAYYEQSLDRVFQMKIAGVKLRR